MKGMRGKGLVVRGWRSYGDNALEAADWYADRFDWAMLTTTNRNPDFCKRLRTRGVPLWFEWVLARPETRWQARGIFEFAAEHGIVGVSVNAEVEWKDKPQEARAFALELEALSQATGVRVGLNSYPIPSMHPNFPWEEFARVAHVGVPEVYMRSGSDDPAGYYDRSIKGYRELGLRSVIPMASLGRRTVIEDAPDTFRSKTPEELAEYLAHMPPTPGVVFWNLGKPSEEILAVLDNWVMPSTTPLPARMLLGDTLANLVFGG